MACALKAVEGSVIRVLYYSICYPACYQASYQASYSASYQASYPASHSVCKSVCVVVASNKPTINMNYRHHVNEYHHRAQHVHRLLGHFHACLLMRRSVAPPADVSIRGGIRRRTCFLILSLVGLPPLASANSMHCKVPDKRTLFASLSPNIKKKKSSLLLPCLIFLNVCRLMMLPSIVPSVAIF